MALKVADWSTTPASNTSVDGVNIAENCPFANMNNMGRAIMSAVRLEVASLGASISASGTPDLGSIGGALTILGVTTVTGFATAPAGLLRTIHFETATPIVPGANLSAPFSSLTTAKGGVMTLRSFGTGAWKIEHYTKPDGSPILTPLPRGYLSGLTVTNDSGDPTNDLGIAAGAARDSTNAFNLVLPSAIVKRLDGSWAVGTNQGMLDGTESVAGTPDIDTWYFIYLIGRSDTGVIDVLASENSTAPTMPTNYDYKALIWAVFNDGSGNVRAFTHLGDDCLWTTAVAASSATASTTEAFVTFAVPTGIKVKAHVTASMDNASAGGCGSFISSPDMANQAATGPLSQLRTRATASQSVGLEMWTDTSGRLRHRESATSASVTLDYSTIGWTFPRPRAG